MDKLKISIELDGVANNTVFLDEEYAQKLYISINSLISRHMKRIQKENKKSRISIEDAYRECMDLGIVTEDEREQKKLLIFYKCPHCLKEQYKIDYPGRETFCNDCSTKVILKDPKKAEYDCYSCGNKATVYVAPDNKPRAVGCSDCKARNEYTIVENS